MKKIMKFKKRKMLFLTSLVGAGFFVAVFVTSCNGPSSDSIKNLLFTGNNELFAKNLSINDVASESLISSEGYTAYLKNQVGKILIHWYKNNKNPEYVKKYNDWVKDVNNDWNRTVQDAKDSYRSSYELNLQQDSLDPKGGTRESWKEMKLVDKVFSDFVESIFSADFLCYEENDVFYINPTPIQLNEPNNWKNLKFKSNPNEYSKKDYLINDLLSNLQSFIFDKWVENTMPLLISSVYFNAATPKSTLSSVFNKNFFTELPSETSYNFQVFANDDDVAQNNPIKTNANYNDFKLNYNSCLDSKTKGVNFKNLWSDDKLSGFLLNKDNFIDSEKGASFLVAINYLLTKPSHVTLANSSDSVDRTNFSDPKFADHIFGNFIVNNPSNSSSAVFRNDATFKSEAFKQNNTQYSYYSKLADPNTYLADIVKVDENLLFIRSEKGAYFVSIDGLNYFVTDNNNLDINKLKLFLKYRSVQKSVNMKESSNATDFNINSQLKSYVKNETLISRILYEWLNNKSNQNLLLKSSNIAVEDISDMLNVNNEFLSYLSAYDMYVDVKDAFYKRKDSRDMIIKQQSIISDAFNNNDSKKIVSLGIAGKLPVVTELNSGRIDSSENIFFVDDTGKYWWKNSNGNLPKNIFINKKYISIDQAKAEVKTKSEAFVKTLSLSKLNNKSEYSQFILSNNNSINFAINSYLNSSEKQQPAINLQIDYFRRGLKGFYNIDNNTFDGDKELSESFEEAVLNTYFSSKIMQAGIENNSLSSYGWYGYSSAGQSGLQLLDKYQKNLRDNFLENNVDKIDYYTFLYTLSYLLGMNKNGTIKLKDYLAQDIPYGSKGYLMWVVGVPLTLNSVISIDEQNSPQLFDVPYNPRNVFGSVDKNIQNYVIKQGSNLLVNKFDKYNDTSNPFRKAKLSDGKDLYGFSGLITNQNYSLVPNVVVDRLYKKYFKSKDISGILSGYETLEKIRSSINDITNIFDLKTFAESINNILPDIDISLIINSSSSVSIEESKNILITNVEKVVNEYSQKSMDVFSRNNYLVDNENIFSNFKSTISKNDWRPIFDESISTTSNIGYYAYFDPVINNEIFDLSTDWSKNQINRLNISQISTFIQIACQYAMNNMNARSAAINDLISKNGDLIQVFDKRLVSNFSTVWFYSKNRGDMGK